MSYITVPRQVVRSIFALSMSVLSALTAAAAVPPPEKLLPPDTLFVVSAPDWTRLREVYKKSPQSQFWDDPAMKPFREKFQKKWDEEFVKPLERDLGVTLDDYSTLLQGQITLAVTQEDWRGKEKDDGDPALLLLLDTRDKSDVLKKNLTDLRKKWNEAGKPIKTEKIRDFEFSVVPLTTNDIPKTLREFFPQKQKVEELGDEEKEPAGKDELVIGQCDSLLIIGTTVKAVEKIVVRLTSTSAPTLAEQAEFEANRAALFRDTPLYGWFNTKTFFDVLVKTLSAKENTAAPTPLPIPWAKIASASGLGGIKTVSFAYRDVGDGRLLEMFLSAPEGSRAGITKLLALAPKESSAPAFVPADVVKFQRTRIDGPKAIATIEKMLGDVSAEALNTWNFVLSNGNEAIKANDPDFDIRKNLFGNLGDDFITYDKLPRGDSALEKASPPSLVLIGSPNPDQLAAAVRGILVILSPEGANPQSREFLGKKIYSVKLASSPMGGRGPKPTLSYAASGGYVAFSTDAAILEEFLRSSESQSKTLRDLPGLADAMARVGGQGTGWFSYENESEAMRLLFDTLRESASDTNKNSSPGVLESAIPFASPEKKFRDWLDFSLLPDYDKVSKYFSFGVYSGAANVDGITFRFYSPTPPQLKK
ncbi:MAG TPA: hypothetical protein VFZ59_11585 [Verrucomicrobiae bacterium]|nr:hypothetical protein [Verrucomicrobiae bacterium]